MIFFSKLSEALLLRIKRSYSNVRILSIKFLDNEKQIGHARAMKEKHTPGPWLLMDRTIYTLSNTDSGVINRWTARVMPGFAAANKTFSQELDANARLMSAAPELLEFSKKVMATLKEFGPAIVPHLLDTDENDGQRLRNAIAKAEGNG